MNTKHTPKESYNYNTDVTLWNNQRLSYLALPNSGAILTVRDGHVSDGVQILARFDDDKHAAQTLEAAGFRCVSYNPFQYKAIHEVPLTGTLHPDIQRMGEPKLFAELAKALSMHSEHEPHGPCDHDECGPVQCDRLNAEWIEYFDPPSWVTNSMEYPDGTINGEVTIYAPKCARHVCKVYGKDAEQVKQSAAFVQRACSSHEALVGACEMALAFWETSTSSAWKDVENALRSALALAKEGR